MNPSVRTDIDEAYLEDHVKRSLNEDIGTGDITTEILSNSTHSCKGKIIAREQGVIAGINASVLTFQQVSARLGYNKKEPKLNWRVEDGNKVSAGQTLASIQGPVEVLLAAERVALNYLQQLSGVASMTATMVNICSPYGVEVFDTRKTVPHMRQLQKYAVRCGGGRNHRLNLSGAVMIKDNHKHLAGGLSSILGGLEAEVPVVVEIHEPEELHQVSSFDIDVVMLDNMSPQLIDELLEEVKVGAEVEVSGGITPDNLEEFAQTKITRVSSGALTHSFNSLDLSLELIPNE